MSGEGNAICFHRLVLRAELISRTECDGGFGGVDGWVVG